MDIGRYLLNIIIIIENGFLEEKKNKLSPSLDEGNNPITDIVDDYEDDGIL